jgi:microsomal dipeptidase-like Zn-dependent dipeptidase
VLYNPFDEIVIDHFHDPPKPECFLHLLELLQRVEEEIRRDFSAQAIVVHNRSELDQAIGQDKLAIVHAVEGGFHLCADLSTIAQNVQTLARHGVAYISVAHLFWRDVAANAPALPFLSDRCYQRIFTEPEAGLTRRGATLVEEMAKANILVDVTHMNELSIRDTFDILPPDMPVIASHMACRFGSFTYNLSDEVIREIIKRDGLLGVILCDHWCNEGYCRTRNWEQSLRAVYRQIDHIHSMDETYDHIAIGTDLDGFIKPTLKGLEDASRLGSLEKALASRYGPNTAKKICSDNALRLMRRP